MQNVEKNSSDSANKVEEVVNKFFDQGTASSINKGLDFLLNNWLESIRQEGKNDLNLEDLNTISGITGLMNFLTELQELSTRTN